MNDGDEGLKRFFNKVYDVLRPGGSFILEPQPWESYAKARRMSQVCLSSNCQHIPSFVNHFIEIERKRKAIMYTSIRFRIFADWYRLLPGETLRHYWRRRYVQVQLPKQSTDQSLHFTGFSRPIDLYVKN